MIGNYICLVKDLAKKELDHGFVLQILSFLQNTFRWPVPVSLETVFYKHFKDEEYLI